MSGHYTRHPAPAGFFKGTQFDLLQTAGRKRQHRQFLVAVGTRGSVPREMLDRSQHPRILHPPDKGCDLARHPMRVFPERTHPDDRVFRLRIHIGRRGEIGIDPHLSAGLPDAPTHPIHQRIVPERPHGQRPGIPEGAVQTHGQPAFQGHGGQKRHPPAVLLRAQGNPTPPWDRCDTATLRPHGSYRSGTAPGRPAQGFGEIPPGRTSALLFPPNSSPDKASPPAGDPLRTILVSKTAGRLSQKPDTPHQKGQEPPQTVFHSDDKILFAFPRAPFLHGRTDFFSSPPLRSLPDLFSSLSFSLLSSVSPPPSNFFRLSPPGTALPG